MSQSAPLPRTVFRSSAEIEEVSQPVKKKNPDEHETCQGVETSTFGPVPALRLRCRRALSSGTATPT